ncbi:MAG TPA: hypothetical protein VNU64_16580 [Burkholderiales bacterium]|jgi:hypothetical protein|nr:hypothetical protein [Burkholderiales bacterium]
MNVIMDAWVQLVQLALLFIVITQNFGLRRRIRNIESKLGIGNPQE